MWSRPMAKGMQRHILEVLGHRGTATDRQGIKINVVGGGGSLLGILGSFLPLILLGGLIFYMIRRSLEGPGDEHRQEPGSRGGERRR